MAAANIESDEEKAKRQKAELASKWLKAIGKRREKEKNWRRQGKEVVKRFRDDRGVEDDTVSKFNIMWANVEVLKPAIFARMPVADVRRRYLTRDPVARTAAMILERALSYCMDSYDFKDTLDRAEEDYLLPGRGQAVVCYKPYFKDIQTRKAVKPLPDNSEENSSGTEDDASEDAQPGETRYPEGTQFDDQGPHLMEPGQEKLYEEVYCEYQEWEYYVFGEGKQRCKVPWEAYGDLLSKDEVREEYPEFEDWEKLTYKGVEGNDQDQKPPDKCLIWRLWHKASRKLMVFAEGYQEAPLQILDDPLQLENFFPSPEPLYALRTNGNDTPKPEFLLYQDQANELDTLVERQRRLTQALKYRGVYDKQLEETAKITDLTRAPDNTFIPVANFNQLAEKGGIENLIDTLPLEEIAQVLGWLAQRIELLKQQIYEIYGISDIVRGATKATETLGAQQLKAQYAGMRISTRQERFQRFVRDILRLKAEIIAEHFSPETLQIMTGIDVMPDQQFEQLKQQQSLPSNTVSQTEFMQACRLIKSDKLRGFRIDIETDSTVPVDKDNEQKNRVEFIGAVGQYLQGVLPAVETGAIPIKLAREGLLFVVRGFKVGTELEEVLEELGENADEAQQLGQLKQIQAQLQEQLQQLQQENQKLQQQNEQLKVGAAVKQQAAEAQAQTNQFSAQNKANLEQQSAAQEAQLDQQKADSDAHIKMLIAEHDAQLAEREMAFEERIKERELAMEERFRSMELSIQAKQAEKTEARPQ